MVKRSVPTRKDNGEASGQPQGRKHASTVGLALHRRDVLALLVTGLLLLLLVLGGVAPQEPRVAQPTGAASGAAVPAGRCDLGTPCTTEVAAESPTRCGSNTPCLADTDADSSMVEEPPAVDALIANVLCDLNSPCAPDPIAAWNRLCDLNTPCLPRAAGWGPYTFPAVYGDDKAR